MILNMVLLCCFSIVSDIDCYLKNFTKLHGIFYDTYLLLYLRVIFIAETSACRTCIISKFPTKYMMIFTFISRTADESKTEIQQQKTTLEKMEKEITELKGQLKDAENKHQMLLKRSQEREQKLTDEINEVKSQKEKALTRYGLYFTVTQVLILSL